MFSHTNNTDKWGVMTSPWWRLANRKRVYSTKKLAIMITNTVSDNIKNTLGEVFDEVIAVDEMDSGDIANLTLLDRTELGITFTKVILPI